MTTKHNLNDKHEKERRSRAVAFAIASAELEADGRKAPPSFIDLSECFINGELNPAEYVTRSLSLSDAITDAKAREIPLYASAAASLLLTRTGPARWDMLELLRLNYRLFKNVAAKGFTQYTPGRMRTPCPAGQYWRKLRPLRSRGDMISSVVYSPLTEGDRCVLKTVLSRIDPEELRSLTPREFGEKMASLWTTLDYIHLFPDGNSRTLRVLIQILAEDCGFRIDWERFNESPETRDRLFVARDLGVNRIALTQYEPNTNVAVMIYDAMEAFKGEPELTELLCDQGVIRKEKKRSDGSWYRRDTLASKPHGSDDRGLTFKEEYERLQSDFFTINSVQIAGSRLSTEEGLWILREASILREELRREPESEEIFERLKALGMTFG